MRAALTPVVFYITRNDCASRRRIKAEKSLSNENAKRSPSSISWQEMRFLASLTQTAMLLHPLNQFCPDGGRLTGR